VTTSVSDQEIQKIKEERLKDINDYFNAEEHLAEAEEYRKERVRQIDEQFGFNPNPAITEQPLGELQLLAKRLMKQYTFLTTTKDGELFCYDTGKGIDLPDQEWIIRQQCRLLVPNIKTQQVQEVINYIKDSTYVDRSIFDSNPDIINLENGTLNIHTLELSEHSPEQIVCLIYL